MAITAPTASPKPTILNRYTTLPILVDILHEKHITLLSPETWEDRNDAYHLERYQVESKLRSVLAICFSLSRETFHHWRVFSSGSSGVCIEFDKDALLRSFAGQEGFRHQPIEYRWVGDVKKKKPELKSWPFIKRKPFIDEQEYRIIFESATDSVRSKSIPIDLSSIRLITLSPWLPAAVAPAVTMAVRGIDGCAKIKIHPSSLINNADWKAAIA
jgi:hypothetical protein